MKQIPLTQGKVALIDDADYELVSRYKWCALKEKTCESQFYAVGWIPERRKNVKMHRMIMGVLDNPKQQIDHRNHDGLDNQRNNLRVCSHADNMHNRRKHVTGHSRYKGVSRFADGKWTATIVTTKDGKSKNNHLGSFTDERQAAQAYNAAAREHFGEFANLNAL